MRKKIFKYIIFSTSFVIGAGFALVFVLFPDEYIKLVIEDGLVENATAISYFLASLIAFVAAMKLRGTRYRLVFWLILIFAAGLFFIGAEEISWGQRILKVEMLESIKRNNRQNEMTVHNLKALNRYLYHAIAVIGLYGTTAWLFIMNCRLGPADIRRYIVPDWCCSSFFLLPLGYASYRLLPNVHADDHFIWPQVSLWMHQEPVEFILALGFLLVAVGNYREIRRGVRSVEAGELKA